MSLLYRQVHVSGVCPSWCIYQISGECLQDHWFYGFQTFRSFEYKWVIVAASHKNTAFDVQLVK